MKFGDKLRELLELHNLSQKELGDLLNIAPSTIGNYVRNIREPDHATLLIFANYFNVSVDFLLDNGNKYNHDHDEQMLITVYKKLSPAHKRILTEEAKVLFNLQEK